jgi:hypothetical protein
VQVIVINKFLTISVNPHEFVVVADRFNQRLGQRMWGMVYQGP